MNHIIIEEENPDKIKDALHLGIKDFNYHTFGQYELQPFAIYMQDAPGVIIAGAYGFKLAKHHTIRMEFVWVKEDLRHQGLGAKILHRVEDYARQLQFHFIQAMTLDFQAPEFYKKMGYQLLGNIPQWFCGHDAIFFSKDIRP